MVDLPVGFRRFSRVGFVNYQLNRWYSLGYSRLGRIFTRAEHAESHCQMGNLALAVGVMADWLDSTASPPR